MHSPQAEPISGHADQADAALREGFGPRVRKLHARIGRSHHQAEGMPFAKALLDDQVSPLQLAALVRALGAPYAFLEQQLPEAAAALGASAAPLPGVNYVGGRAYLIVAVHRCTGFCSRERWRLSEPAIQGPVIAGPFFMACADQLKQPNFGCLNQSPADANSGGASGPFPSWALMRD